MPGAARRRRDAGRGRPAPSWPGSRGGRATGGAVEAGCLPNLLPGGRPVADAAARVDVATAWGVERPAGGGRPRRRRHRRGARRRRRSVGWSSAASTPTTPPTRPAFRAALEAASFVVALELRETDVTRAAEVVFPWRLSPTSPAPSSPGRAGCAPSSRSLANPGSLPDLRVLSGIADEPAVPLGFRTVAEVRAEMEALGPGTASVRRCAARDACARDPIAPDGDGSRSRPGRKLIDLGSMQDGAASDPRHRPPAGRQAEPRVVRRSRRRPSPSAETAAR